MFVKSNVRKVALHAMQRKGYFAHPENVWIQCLQMLIMKIS